MLLPLATFLYSLEMFVKTVQGIQAIVSQSLNSMTGEVPQLLDNAPASEGEFPRTVQGGTSGESANHIQPARQLEERYMPDLDLGGDDLKYVSYSIVFTKRDYEATLQVEKQEIVDYATDGANYGALKIGEFFALLPEPGIPRPPVWLANNYPSNVAAGQENMAPGQIPAEDRKYVRFIYRVDQRLSKSEADYEKRKTRALEDISRKIG